MLYINKMYFYYIDLIISKEGFPPFPTGTLSAFEFFINTTPKIDLSTGGIRREPARQPMEGHSPAKNA